MLRTPPGEGKRFSIPKATNAVCCAIAILVTRVLSAQVPVERTDSGGAKAKVTRCGRQMG